MRKCCVPGCYSNHMKPYVPTFLFPKDENRRKQWVKCIGHPDLKISNNVGVCMKHFEEKDVVRFDSVETESGLTDTPRRKVKLRPNACPTVISPKADDYASKDELNQNSKPSPQKGALPKRQRRRRSTMSSKNSKAASTLKSKEADEQLMLRKLLEKPKTTSRPIITVLKVEDADIELIEDGGNMELLEAQNESLVDVDYLSLDQSPSNFILRSRTEEKTTASGERISPKKRSSSVGSNSSNGSSETAKSSSSAPKRRKVEKQLPLVIGKTNDCYCWVCHKESVSLSCFVCPRAYHLRCAGETEAKEDWVCPECCRTTAAENVDTRSKVLCEISLEKFCMLLKCCISKLRCRSAAAFHQPVPVEYYSSYLHYVIHPMDLGTIEKNVKAKMYGCTESFLADVKWIQHNSCVFNGSQHPLSISAKSLVKTCEADMAEIEVCPDCFLHACTRNKYWFSELCQKPHPLVWAKLKGFPYWPAKVVRIQDQNIDARFFGAHDRAWVPVAQCYHLSKEMPTTSKPKKKGNYDVALEELDVHVRALKRKYGVFEYAPYRTPFDPDNKLFSYHGIDIDRISAKTEPPQAAPTVNGNSPASCPSVPPLAPSAIGSDSDSSAKPLIKQENENSKDSCAKVDDSSVGETSNKSQSNDSDSMNMSKKSVPIGIFEISKDYEIDSEAKNKDSIPPLSDLKTPSASKFESTLKKLRQILSIDTEIKENSGPSSEGCVEESMELCESTETADKVDGHKAEETNAQKSSINSADTDLSESLNPENNLPNGENFTDKENSSPVGSVGKVSEETSCNSSKTCSDSVLPNVTDCEKPLSPGNVEVTAAPSSISEKLLDSNKEDESKNLKPKEDNTTSKGQNSFGSPGRSSDSNVVSLLKEVEDGLKLLAGNQIYSETENEVLPVPVSEKKICDVGDENEIVQEAISNCNVKASSGDDTNAKSSSLVETKPDDKLGSVPSMPKVDAFNLKLDETIQSCLAKLGMTEISADKSATSESGSDDEEEEDDEDEEEEDDEDEEEEDSEDNSGEKSTAVSSEASSEDESEDESSESSSSSNESEEDNGQEITTIGELGSIKSSMNGTPKIISPDDKREMEIRDCAEESVFSSCLAAEKTSEKDSVNMLFSSSAVTENHSYCSKSISEVDLDVECAGGTISNIESVLLIDKQTTEISSFVAETERSSEKSLSGGDISAGPASKKNAADDGDMLNGEPMDVVENESCQNDLVTADGNKPAEAPNLWVSSSSEDELEGEGDLQICSDDENNTVGNNSVKSLASSIMGKVNVAEKNIVLTSDENNLSPLPQDGVVKSLLNKPSSTGEAKGIGSNVEEKKDDSHNSGVLGSQNISFSAEEEQEILNAVEHSAADDIKMAKAQGHSSPVRDAKRPAPQIIDCIDLDSSESDDDVIVEEPSLFKTLREEPVIDISSSDENDDDDEDDDDDDEESSSKESSSDGNSKDGKEADDKFNGFGKRCSVTPEDDISDKNKRFKEIPQQDSEPSVTKEEQNQSCINEHFPVIGKCVPIDVSASEGIKIDLCKGSVLEDEQSKEHSIAVVDLGKISVNHASVKIAKTDGDPATASLAKVMSPDVCKDKSKPEDIMPTENREATSLAEAICSDAFQDKSEPEDVTLTERQEATSIGEAICSDACQDKPENIVCHSDAKQSTDKEPVTNDSGSCTESSQPEGKKTDDKSESLLPCPVEKENETAAENDVEKLREIVQTQRDMIRLHKLRVQKMEWFHSQEIVELKHNMNLILAEMRAALEANKKVSVESLKKQHHEELSRAVTQAKEKQWCATCKEPSIFYCCWNTSYCSHTCQKHHWPLHRFSCSQVKPPPLRSSSSDYIKIAKKPSEQVADTGAVDKKLLYVSVRSSDILPQSVSASPQPVLSQSQATNSQKLQLISPKGQQFQLVSSASVNNSGQGNGPLLLPSTPLQFVITPVKTSEGAQSSSGSPVRQKAVQDSSEIITKVRSRQTNLNTAIQLLNKMNKETEETLKRKHEGDSSDQATVNPPKMDIEMTPCIEPSSNSRDGNTSDNTLTIVESAVDEQAASPACRMIPFGRGTEISEISLRNCLKSGSNSSTKLTRALVDAFFPDLELLAHGYVPCKESESDHNKEPKPGLPDNTVEAIIDFVMTKFPTAERSELLLTMNLKCKEAQQHLARYNQGNFSGDEASKSTTILPNSENKTENNENASSETTENRSSSTVQKSPIPLTVTVPLSSGAASVTGPTLSYVVPKTMAQAIRTIYPKNVQIVPPNKIASNRLVFPRMIVSPASSKSQIAIKPKPTSVSAKPGGGNYVQIPSSNILQVIPARSGSSSPSKSVYVSGNSIVCTVKGLKSTESSNSGQCMQTTAINQPVMSVKGSTSTDSDAKRPVVILGLSPQQQ